MTDQSGAVREQVAADGKVGVIAGIGRHSRPKAVMETLARAEITLHGGITGDHRGFRKPGSAGKRQVTLIDRRAWEAAMAEVGCDLPWHDRRCNLLIDGFVLPRTPGTLIRLGQEVVLETTRFTDPCVRMEALAPGLFAALMRDWRGGICTRVIAGGDIAIGDTIRMNE